MNKRREEAVKWLGVWEMDSKDMDVNLKKYQELLAAREKKDPRFPLKPLSDNFAFVGAYKGFIIYDDDTTEEQLANVAFHFKDTMKWKFKPLMFASKTIELYMKSKE
jgi:hypothetical protein